MAIPNIHPPLLGQQVIHDELNHQLAFPNTYRCAHRESLHGVFLLWMSYYIGSLLAWSDGSPTATVYTLSPTPPSYSPHHVCANFSIPSTLVMAISDINASHRVTRSSLGDSEVSECWGDRLYFCGPLLRCLTLVVRSPNYMYIIPICLRGSPRCGEREHELPP